MARKRTDWEKEWERVAKEYRRLAKQANERMVRLERYSEREQFKGILEMAYAVAQKEIHGLYGKTGDHLRYTERPKMYDVYKDGKLLEGQQLAKANIQMLDVKIKSIQKFLGSKTSTIADIKAKDPKTGKWLRDKEGNFIIEKEGALSVMDKRAKSLNERIKNIYGLDLDLNAEDLRRFFESRKQAKAGQEFGSDGMFIVAAVMKEKKIAANKRELQKFFKEHINLDASGLTEDDLKLQRGKDGKIESRADYFNRLSEFVELTGNAMLDDYIAQAIEMGIGYKQLFI